MEKIVDYINVNRDHYIDQLKAFLAIPSISALPAHNADTRRCAEWVAAELTRIGLHSARLVETPGHPVVYAEWLGAPGAPTMLFYGHYDVQPVDPLNLWTSPPFEATVRDGELFARGAVDDKGQVLHKLRKKQWDDWNNRLIKNSEYNWREHKGSQAGASNQPKRGN